MADGNFIEKLGRKLDKLFEGVEGRISNGLITIEMTDDRVIFYLAGVKIMEDGPPPDERPATPDEPSAGE